MAGSYSDFSSGYFNAPEETAPQPANDFSSGYFAPIAGEADASAPNRSLPIGARIGAGVEQGLRNVVQASVDPAAAYLSKKFGDVTLGGVLPTTEQANLSHQQATQQFGRQFGNDTLAKVGEMGGEIGATLPIVAAGGTALAGPLNYIMRASPEISQTIAQAPTVAKYLGGIAKVGAEGAASNALIGGSPQQGAEAGAILGAAGPAVAKLGGALASPFTGGTINPAVAQLAQTAEEKYGIKIPGGLLSENPLTNRVYSMLDRLGLTGSSENATKFTQGVASSFGSDATALTRQAMNDAESNIGKMYDEVHAATPLIKVSDNTLTKLANIEQQASELLPQGDTRIQKQLENILDLASKNNGAIPSTAWQNLVGSKSSITKLSKMGPDPVSGLAADLKGTLYDALGESAPQEVADKFAQANEYYKNLKTVQKFASKDPVTGEIDPTSIARNVLSTTKKYGAGGMGTLQELGDIGRQFNLTNSSGTAENLIAAKILGGLGETALAFHSPMLAAQTAGAGLAAAGVGRAAGAALSSDWYRNALIQRSLQEAGAQAAPSALSRYGVPIAVPALNTAGLLGGKSSP